MDSFPLQDERAIAVAEANFDALIEESLDKAFDEANCESPGKKPLARVRQPSCTIELHLYYNQCK